MEQASTVGNILSMGALHAICETGINDLIKEMLNSSYLYIAIYAYFDRDNVALKGFAKFFKDLSDREREHALKLMKYLNTRGGIVRLYSLDGPLSEYFDFWNGENAFRAMELTLWLEKTTYQKLQSLVLVAAQQNDPEIMGFIEREFLAEKMKAVSKIQEYVTQLGMVGKGYGVWNFDQKLLNQG